MKRIVAHFRLSLTCVIKSGEAVLSHTSYRIVSTQHYLNIKATQLIGLQEQKNDNNPSGAVTPLPIPINTARVTYGAIKSTAVTIINQ